MALQFKLSQGEGRFISLLLALYVLTTLPSLIILPLIKDEAVYSIMMEEQAHSPTLVPTFLGYPVSWKPILFFWVGALFSKLPLPLEVAYRLPSFLCGLLSVPLIYLILKRIGGSANLAFVATLISLVSYVSIYTNAKALTDAPVFLAICLAFYLYLRTEWGSRRYLPASGLIFIAFFLKFVMAALIPLLAVSYFFFHGRKTLWEPLFWCSFLAFPAAFLLNLHLLNAAGLGAQVGLSLASNALASNGLSGQIGKATVAITTLFLGGAIWFSLALLGFVREWRNSPFMAFWFSLIVFPMVSATYLMWYFLPVMPAVGYFAASLLLRWEGRERPDRLFMAVFCLLLVASLAIAAYLETAYYDFYNPEREAGLLLAGKENVAVIGSYSPTLISSKMTSEWHSMGAPLDMGWITSGGLMNRSQIEEYVADYHSSRFPVVDGTFDEFFTTNQTFRKDTDIADFDYMVVLGGLGIRPPSSEIAANCSGIIVYKISAE